MLTILLATDLPFFLAGALRLGAPFACYWQGPHALRQGLESRPVDGCVLAALRWLGLLLIPQRGLFLPVALLALSIRAVTIYLSAPCWERRRYCC